MLGPWTVFCCKLLSCLHNEILQFARCGAGKNPRVSNALASLHIFPSDWLKSLRHCIVLCRFSFFLFRAGACLLTAKVKASEEERMNWKCNRKKPVHFLMICRMRRSVVVRDRALLVKCLSFG